jgi:hypothetical protein
MNEDSKEWSDAEKEEDELAKAAEVDDDEEMKDAATTETETANEERGVSNEEDEEVMEGEWQEDWQDDDADQGSEHDGDNSNEEDEEEMEGEMEGEWQEDWQDGDADQGSEHDEDDSNEEENTKAVPIIGEYDDFSDNASQASEIGLEYDFDLADGAKDDTDSMFNFHEKNSYDPTKFSQEDVQWTDRSRALAINREWKGEKKAFLSGRGRYNDYVSKIRHGIAPLAFILC